MNLSGLEVLPEVVALGVAFGLAYGLLGVGLILAFRVSGVINFAQADIGVAAATFLAVAVTRWHVPYWFALPPALLLGAVVGAVAHVAIHRLRSVPPLISVVATLGLGQVLLRTAAATAGPTAGDAFPAPPGLRTFDLGALHIGTATSAMFVSAPVVVLVLWLWLARSRSGLELRASAANPAAAKLLGLPTTRLAALGWAVAGALSALTAVLVGSAPGFVGGNASGPGLLLRALTAGVIAGMHSVPIALSAGVVIGVVEQVASWNANSPSIVDALLFLLVGGALLVRRRDHARAATPTAWVRLDVWRPLPRRLSQLRSVRYGARAAAIGAAVLALLLPAVVSHSTAVVLTAIIAFATVGLSVTVVTGLGGMLSLGQFAIAGAGAVASVHVVARTGNFLLGFAAAAAVGAVVAALTGLPALRIRGQFLAVTTLAFALAAETWLFPQSWALGSGTDPAKPVVASLALESGRRYYFVALAAGAVMLWLLCNLHRSGVARRLIAVRDNQPAAQAFGIDTTRTMFLGFAVGGAIAGVGGAVYGHSLTVVSGAAFPVTASIAVVAMAVVGGIGMLLGPLVGALYIIGIPAFLPLDAAWLAATAFGWLVLVLYVPAGVAQPLRVVRDRFAATLARLDGGAPDRGAGDGGDRRRRASASFSLTESPQVGTGPAASVVLQAVGLRRAFAGVPAVDGVDVRVGGGEIVGIVGPNGAGKTTLVDLLAGALQPDGGRVQLTGDDITSLRADQRARRGVVRSFQEPRLFPTLTPLDAVLVAQEVHVPTRLAPALIGWRRDEAQRTARARHIVTAFGLDPYAEVPVHTLSTGTRRVCELACLAALHPSVLLLDEPSAGLAQAEVAGLGQLLTRLRDQLNVALVVVEHDLRLITSISDRLLIMNQGRIVDEVVGGGDRTPPSRHHCGG